MKVENKYLSVKMDSNVDLNEISSKGTHCTTDSVELITIDGMHLKPRPLAKWKPSNTYSQGDIIDAEGIYYECLEGGISGKVAPNWEFNPSIVEVHGSTYICIKEHRSSYDNRPIQRNNYTEYWMMAQNVHICRDSW